MGLLMSAFNEQVKSSKDHTQENEMSYSISYPTGYLSLDFANGYIQEVNGVKRFELGISDGSINMMISDSGVGKTTLACQAACNIIKPFPEGVIFYEQAEIGTNIQRIKNISGFNDEEFIERFKIRDAGITTQSVYNRVKMIHESKLANKNKLLYDTGMTYKGEKVYKYQPTVVIVDSIKMVMSDANLEKDTPSNMEGAQNANANAVYYSRMVPMCRETNIIMILINHITTDINTNSMMHKKPELPYLKPGEHIVGGKTLTYIQNNIFRLDIKTKLKAEEAFGILGSIVNIDIVKSRSNKTAKARCELVYDFDLGYDSDLSLFWLLKINNLLEGSGAYLRVPGSDIKFSQKTFKKVLYENPEVRYNFISICANFLSTNMLNEFNRIKAERENKISELSIYQNILNQINTIGDGDS